MTTVWIASIFGFALIQGATSQLPSPLGSEAGRGKALSAGAERGAGNEAGTATPLAPAQSQPQVIVQQTNGSGQGLPTGENWPTLVVSVLTLGVLGLQVRAMIRQNKISESQQRLIEEQGLEAKRSIKATEDIAASLAESGKISQNIFDRQKLVTELAARAYVSASFFSCVYQDASHVFEPRVNIANKGTTPAYDVTFKCSADVLSFPVHDDFDFPLSRANTGTSVSVIGPTLHREVGRLVARQPW